MSYYQASKAFNHAVDLDALDQLALNNFQAKEKQLSMMKNLLDELSGLIGGYNSSKIDFIATKLQEQGFGCKQLKKACEIIPERLDKFPSFKDLKSVLKESSQRKEEYKRDAQIDKDQKRCEMIKKLFLSKASQEKLTRYVEWWLKEVYNLTKEKIPLDSVYDLYEMPALFDWYDCFGEWNLEKIKSLANKKNEYLIDRNENNLSREAMWLNKNEV